LCVDGEILEEPGIKTLLGAPPDLTGAIADVHDALVSGRVYRCGPPPPDAVSSKEPV